MNDIKPPHPRASQPVPRPSLPAPVHDGIPSQNAVDTPPPIYTPEKRRWGWIILAVIVLTFLCVAGGALWWYNDALLPRSASSSQTRITVNSGDTWDKVMGDLEQKGIIKNKLAASVYLRLHNQPNLKAGTYMLAPNQKLEEIIRWLGEGRIDTRKLTILPGRTLAELQKSLVEQGYPAQEIEAAFSHKYDHALLADKPAVATLEGYIFPETYFVAIDEPLQNTLKRSFDEFQKQLEAKKIRESLKAQGFDLHQGIILASIIEREVGKPADRRQVAQVLLTRHKANMMLGADATYEYAAKMLGVEPSPSIDSPYNTRKYPGLPPGPISTIPINALEALVNPAPGDFIYYVSGDDGTTHFSHTLGEHEEKTRKYCTKACFGIE